MTSSRPTEPDQRPVGGLLTSQSLRRELCSGNVFDVTTLNEANIRESCYDLTLANDLLVVPAKPGSDQVIAYAAGEERTREVVLAPGDTAFVATKERMQLAWHLAGIVGQKFRLATRGLFILTGLAVDPGYGLEPDGRGGWRGLPDERIYLVLANVGPDQITLRPGEERLAALQLFAVEPPVDPTPITNPGFFAFREQFFSSDPGKRPTGGLVYFTRTRDLEHRVDQLHDDVREEIEKLGEHVRDAIEQLRSEVEATASRLETVERGSNYVVTFGIYLVATAILGALVAYGLQTVASLPAHLSTARLAIVATAGGLFSLFVVIGLVIALRRLAAPAR